MDFWVEEEYDRLYKGAIARDKELYALYTDIHELKCAILTFLDPGCSLPEKPKFVPLCTLDVNIPSPTDTNDVPSYDDGGEDGGEVNFNKEGKRVSIGGKMDTDSMNNQSARRPSSNAPMVDDRAQEEDNVVNAADDDSVFEPEEDEEEDVAVVDPRTRRAQTPQLRDHKRSKLSRQDKEVRRRSAPASVFKELNQMSIGMLSRAVHSSTASGMDLTPVDRRSIHGSNNMIPSKTPSAVNLLSDTNAPSNNQSSKMTFAEKGVQSFHSTDEQDGMPPGSSATNECNVISHFNKSSGAPPAHMSKKKTRTPRTSETEPPLPVLKVNRSTSPALSLRIDSRRTSMTGVDSGEELDDASVYSLQWVYPSGPYDIKNTSSTSLHEEGNEPTPAPATSSKHADPPDHRTRDVDKRSHPESSGHRARDIDKRSHSEPADHRARDIDKRNHAEPSDHRARDVDKRSHKESREPRLKSKETYIGAGRIRTESSSSSSSSSSSGEGNESHSDEESSSSCGSSDNDSLDINSINTSMSSLDVVPAQGPSHGRGQNLSIETDDNSSSEDDINLSIDATDYATFQTLMKIRASKWSYQKK